MTIKTCRKCGVPKPADNFRKGRRQCKACEYQRSQRSRVKYRTKNPARVKALRRARYKRWHSRRLECPARQAKYEKQLRAYNLKKKYGLTTEQYEQMVNEQNGKCAICGEVPEGGLTVDHCHRSGVVRALLCGFCNAGLGDFRDDPQRLESAARYLLNYGDSSTFGLSLSGSPIATGM